jgi:hypothetical protein
MAFQPERPNDSEATRLLRMWGQMIAALQPLIDQTIYAFENDRVGQAAEEEINREAKHYLGILGETLDEVKDVMRKEYDYTEWWHKIPVRLDENDQVLSTRLRQALATQFRREMKNPVEHPALFSLKPAPSQPHPAGGTDPHRQFSDWHPASARTRLAQQPGRRNADQNPTEGDSRDHPR